MRVLVAVFAALAAWLVAGLAAAHTVSLSQSEFTVDGANVHAIVVFAKADAILLGKMDPDGDGVVTPDELAASQATFRAVVERGIQVTADGAPCAAALEGGGDVEGDGFGLSIQFACPAPPRELAITMGILRELLPGHRHMARLYPRSGAADAAAQVEREASTVDAVLTADSPTLRASIDSVSPTSGTAAGIGSAVRLGVLHILTGWDHLLFLVALLLGTRGLKSLALAVTAFTVAHSITLALAAFDVVRLSPRLVEPAIAASIAYVAFENAWRPQAAHRWRATFVFGLVHGLGFAGALRDLALPRDRLLPVLLGFNAGVEVGQLVVVAALVPAIAFTMNRLPDGAIATRTASIALGFVGLAVLVARVVAPS